MPRPKLPLEDALGDQTLIRFYTGSLKKAAKLGVNVPVLCRTAVKIAIQNKLQDKKLKKEIEDREQEQTSYSTKVTEEL